MPVYSFSTKTANPKDTELVDKIKAECNRNHRNFSGLIVELLTKYKEEQDGRAN